jgi:hypothetical protein
MVCVLQLLELRRADFVPVLFLLFGRKKTYFKGGSVPEWIDVWVVGME